MSPMFPNIKLSKNSPVKQITLLKQKSQKNKEKIVPTISENLLQSISCPITMEIMYDPVITIYGDTFERANIKKWLLEHATCPLTRKPLSMDNIVSNVALKLFIQELIKCKKIPASEYIMYEKICNNYQQIDNIINNATSFDTEIPSAILMESNLQQQEPIVQQINGNINEPPAFLDIFQRYISELDIPQSPNFDFIADPTDNHIYSTAYFTVNRLQAWGYIKFIIESNIRNLYNDAGMQFIMQEIERDYGGHSGTSMFVTMRAMTYIAMYGFTAFREKKMNNAY